MRTLLLLFAVLLAACGGQEPPARPPPLEVPKTVEPPTPPPLSEDELADMLPVEPPLPPDARPPEPTPAPTPVSATDVPAGAKALTFEQVVFADGVQDRAPKGVKTRFSDGQEVTCYMRVRNPGPKRDLKHVWYHEGVRKGAVAVRVGGPSWRTWTSRPAYGLGSWRVDVVDEAGTVLHSASFEVQ